jgi:hypothetical protein
VPVSGISIVNEAVSTRAIDPVVEAMIDREWQRQVDLAARSGKTYYDAEGYRLNDFTATGQGIELRLAPIAYRIHATMKALHTRPEVRAEHLDHQVIVDSLVRTADRCVVLHAVEKVVETETYMIGGSCSKSRLAIDSGDDLAAYALDRVDAVLGLTPEERELMALVALVQNENGCVHTIFDVGLTLTSDELRAQFRPGPTTKALEIIPVAGYRNWLAAASGYMSVMAPVDPIWSSDLPSYSHANRGSA